MALIARFRVWKAVMGLHASLERERLARNRFPSSDESLASARRRARPNTGSLRAKRVHQHLPAAARPGKARDGQFG